MSHPGLALALLGLDLPMSAGEGWDVGRGTVWVAGPLIIGPCGISLPRYWGWLWLGT